MPPAPRSLGDQATGPAALIRRATCLLDLFRGEQLEVIAGGEREGARAAPRARSCAPFGHTHGPEKSEPACGSRDGEIAANVASERRKKINVSYVTARSDMGFP